MEGHRNHGSSSGWSERVGVTWSVQEIDPLIEREGDENSAIFNATEADIAVLKSEYSVDTQHDCDSGSNSQWENGDEMDFERNAFDAFDDEPHL